MFIPAICVCFCCLFSGEVRASPPPPIASRSAGTVASAGGTKDPKKKIWFPIEPWVAFLFGVLQYISCPSDYSAEQNKWKEHIWFCCASILIHISASNVLFQRQQGTENKTCPRCLHWDQWFVSWRTSNPSSSSGLLLPLRTGGKPAIYVPSDWELGIAANWDSYWSLLNLLRDSYQFLKQDVWDSCKKRIRFLKNS